MQDDRMSDNFRNPAPPSQTVYPNLGNANVHELMLNSRSDPTLSAIHQTFRISSLAPVPSAVVGHGLLGNAEDIPDQAKTNFQRVCESTLFFSPGNIPSMSVPASQNLGSAYEQAVVADNTLLPHRVLQNPPNLHPLCASQGLWLPEGQPAIFPTTVNVTNNFSQDLPISIPLHQPGANSETVPPPQQSSDSVPQAHNILAILSNRGRKLGLDEQKNLEGLLSNLNIINEKTDTNAGKRTREVIQAVDDYGGLQYDQLKGELEDRDKAKLEGERRKSAQSNINTQTRKERLISSTDGYVAAVFSLAARIEQVEGAKDHDSMARIEQLEAKDHRSMATIKRLEAEIRRLNSLLGGLSSMGLPHDDPPSGGPPPKDDGHGDDSDAGDPRHWFPSFIDQLVLHGNSSSNGNFPSQSARNTPLPRGTCEDLAGSASDINSCPEKSDSSDESSAVSDPKPTTTEHLSIEDTSNGVKRTQKIDEPTVTEERMPKPRSTKEEGDQMGVSSRAIHTKLARVAEHDTKTSTSLIDLSTPETGRTGKSSQCLTPEVSLIPLISPRLRMMKTCRQFANSVIPEREMPPPFALPLPLAVFYVRNLAMEKR